MSRTDQQSMHLLQIIRYTQKNNLSDPREKISSIVIFLVFMLWGCQDLWKMSEIFQYQYT
jgi:hypothetical protein